MTGPTPILVRSPLFFLPASGKPQKPTVPMLKPCPMGLSHPSEIPAVNNRLATLENAVDSLEEQVEAAVQARPWRKARMLFDGYDAEPTYALHWNPGGGDVYLKNTTSFTLGLGKRSGTSQNTTSLGSLRQTCDGPARTVYIGGFAMDLRRDQQSQYYYAPIFLAAEIPEESTYNHRLNIKFKFMEYDNEGNLVLMLDSYGGALTGSVPLTWGSGGYASDFFTIDGVDYKLYLTVEQLS